MPATQGFYQTFDQHLDNDVFIICPEEEEYGDVTIHKSFTELNVALSCSTPGVDDIKVLHGTFISAKNLPDNIEDAEQIYIVIEHVTRMDHGLVLKFKGDIDTLQREIEDLVEGTSNNLAIINEDIDMEYIYLLIGYTVPTTFAVDPTSIDYTKIKIGQEIAKTAKILGQVIK